MYALFGLVSRDILTYQGRPLVHHDRLELEFLFPASRVVPVTDRDLAARSPLPPMPIAEHPDMAGVSWPLDPTEFR
jgi:hypothetical protein